MDEDFSVCSYFLWKLDTPKRWSNLGCISAGIHFSFMRQVFASRLNRNKLWYLDISHSHFQEAQDRDLASSLVRDDVPFQKVLQLFRELHIGGKKKKTVSILRRFGESYWPLLAVKTLHLLQSPVCHLKLKNTATVPPVCC